MNHKAPIPHVERIHPPQIICFGSNLRRLNLAIDTPNFFELMSRKLADLESTGCWSPALDLEAPLMSVIEAYPEPSTEAALSCLQVFASWPGAAPFPPSIPIGSASGPAHAAAFSPHGSSWLRAMGCMDYPLDVANRRGTTPLMLAAQTGNIASVAFLLESGSDPLAADFQGKSAMEYANNFGDLFSVRLDPVMELISSSVERTKIQQGLASGSSQKQKTGRL